MKKKVLIACKIFENELSTISIDNEMEIIWIDEALHVNLFRLEHAIKAAVSQAEAKNADIYLLFGNGCHPEINELVRQYGVCISPVNSCIEAFCGERKTELEQSGAMIMTPAWVRAWPAMMEGQGWNEVDARMNLGRYERIVVVDAGLKPLSDEEIIEFFDVVQVPVEIEDLKLDHFKSIIDRFLE